METDMKKIVLALTLAATAFAATNASAGGYYGFKSYHNYYKPYRVHCTYVQKPVYGYDYYGRYVIVSYRTVKVCH